MPNEPLNLSASWGDAALRLPAIHLVFGLAVFRFNRRTANSIVHRFARVIQQGVLTPPALYRDLVNGRAT